MRTDPEPVTSASAEAARPAAAESRPSAFTDVVLARLLRRSADGLAWIDLTAVGLPAAEVPTASPLDGAEPGDLVALVFLMGDANRPLVIGKVANPEAASASPAFAPTQDVVSLHAASELELRCGRSAIVLTADGRVQLRGDYITSHATATQRLLGGTVQIN